MTCYELAQNPDIQRELHDEIDAHLATLNGKPVTYEALRQMSFLDMVVSESLRKWPPAPQIERSCTKDYSLDMGNGRRIEIKKGQIIFFPIYHLQHDPNYYPNPEQFDPRRFSDENRNAIIPGTYIPFGIGPRTCIGARFALMEAKLLLFHFFSKFSVEKCLQTPETVTYDAILFHRIKEKIFLKFVFRESLR